LALAAAEHAVQLADPRRPPRRARLLAEILQRDGRGRAPAPCRGGDVEPVCRLELRADAGCPTPARREPTLWVAAGALVHPLDLERIPRAAVGALAHP